MSCTLRIKYSDIEVEFTGEEAFAETHLKPLLDSITKVLQTVPAPAARKESAEKNNQSHSTSGKSAITTSTAATKLGAKSGTDLASAAAFVLHAGGKETFTRNELLQEMKGAKAYFQVNYRKNLGQSLGTLVKQGSFLDQGSDNYALSVTYRAELDKKLA